MKGLLLKDFYMMRAYCKSYLLILVVFLAASFVGGNLFFTYYPCVLCGMIPVNLLAYDERSRFTQYSAALPVSRAQMVSEKYLIGLIAQAAVLTVTGIVQGIRMSVNGGFVLSEFTLLMLSLLLVSLVIPSVPLPFIFRHGVEKGRMAYYVMIGLVCGCAVLFSEAFSGKLRINITSGIIFALLIALGICMYIASWRLSVKLYKKREL